jgi:hypothetical protein
MVLCVILYGYETWSFIIREEHRFEDVLEQGNKENILA